MSDFLDELGEEYQKPKADGDCISREKAKQFLYERIDRLNNDELYDIFSGIIDDLLNELRKEGEEQK